ncbi:alpha/beta fold hydrolase [Fulvivirga sp. M361]|uniref:YheT family hydrolase n=1 Tax=Fulvivirga sp. M361 TaxID=2594266 RepID=UPI00117B892C|nr:alpha/beta fold hydrolase [Fulvivirga sp. M361]TRX52406.1 alpha/beta fold hydrolase [Fulvivirga sp. M361]
MHYKPPLFYFHPHLETIVPALFRKIRDFDYTLRERINTPDDDFLDIDMHQSDSKEVVILSHGLEGNSTRPYILGMARAFSKKGYDVMAWNYRGCSEEMNKRLRFYHSGATDDLGLIIDHALNKGYAKIHLVGFSLGGNLTLKYLGEQGEQFHRKIASAVVFSVPLDLHKSCLQISKRNNFMYAQRFLKNLKNKVKIKALLMPDSLNTDALKNIKTLIDFDDHYTAPLHGFENAIHYYQSCSSIYYLDNIQLPTLIVNAVNDPFLSEECYPKEQLKSHAYVTLETPDYGGHVGFTNINKNGLYWSEQRALDFVGSLKD